MKSNRFKVGWPAVTGYILSALLLSCTPVLPPLQSISRPTAPAVRPTRQVTFSLNFDSANGFHTKQTAQANFIKLVITDGTTVKHAHGADGNGYVTVSGATTTVGADVPDGQYWVATVGRYTNKSDDGLLGNQMKAAFHVPQSNGSVAINAGTWLCARLIENLRGLDPTWLATNTPNLADYKAFTDSLTGLTLTGDNYSFTRLDPTLIDSRTIALKIKDGSITAVTGTEGGLQDPNNYKQAPVVEGDYSALTESAGIFNPVTIDHPNSRILFADRSSEEGTNTPKGQKNYSSIYAVNQTATQLNEAWKINLPTKHNMMSHYMSLGMSTNRLYFTVKNATTNPPTFYLRAMNSVTGSMSWAFNFPGNSSLAEAGRFSPIPWRNRNGSTCGCPGTWGVERIFVAYNGNTPGDSGVYAINDGGTQAWFYAAPNGQKIWSGGALSKDSAVTPFAANVYVIAQHDGVNFSKLIALDTITGNANWTLDLGSQSKDGSAPVLGTDGTIYVLTHDAGGTQGYLEAINPDGTRKWSTPYALGAVPVNGSPVVDRQGGQDVIFIATQDKKLHAVYENKTAKWANPFVLPHQPQAFPVVGEEPDGTHVLFIGQEMTQSALAIRDVGITGEQVWNMMPHGPLSTGFALRNNKLLASSFSGSTGQDVRLTALKVLAAGVPAAAPWPMAGGSFAHAGRTSLGY